MQPEGGLWAGKDSRSLTVICVTYGRPWSTQWQKALWAPYPLDLVLADGSDDLPAGSSSGQAGRCRWTKLDMPGSTYFERFQAAGLAVRTRHAILIDDEEAYFYSGLLAASQELDRNPQASCAGGSAAHVRRVQRKLLARPFSGRIADWSVPFALEDDDPAVRIEQVLSTYRTGNLYYSVIRANFLKDFCLHAPVQEVEETLIGLEFLWVASLAASGSYSMGRYPFWLRMGGSQASSRTLRETLSDSEIDAIATYVAGHVDSPSAGLPQESLSGAVRRGIRRWEDRVFGSERPSRQESQRRSRDTDYLRSFLAPSSYFALYEPLPASFSADLSHIFELAASSVRPAETLDDAMK